MHEAARSLLEWYPLHARDLPWRKDIEPYHIWLSEIMLQQTRAQTVEAYYLRFLSRLPDITALIEAEEETVVKLWEGLGYYNRARNLQKAAIEIRSRFGGKFPSTYAEILSLPGIGRYTAGAIGSICFGLPTPAVDGNVIRVLSRLNESPEPADTDEFKTKAEATLLPVYQALTPSERGMLTQALMELGACVCVPNGIPFCESCPLKKYCSSGKNGTWANYPVRREKKKRRRITKTVLVLRCGDRIAIRKRPNDGLLASLWELPNKDTQNESLCADPSHAADFAVSLGVAPRELLGSSEYKHIFTHVEWQMTCYSFTCAEPTGDLTWVTNVELRGKYALPSAFRPFLTE